MRNQWIGVALLGSIVLLTGGTPAAWGQIAAPSIAPGTFSSENPATIKWGAPSRFGLAAVGQRETTTPSTQTTDWAGGLIGLRLVGESFAFGMDFVHLDDQESSLKDVRDTGSVALALQTGSSIAWGLGYNAFNNQTDTFDQSTKEPTFGISLRLGEVWFLGAVVGRESVETTAHDVTVIPTNGDRDTLRYGLGFRRGGTVLVHAEVFGANKRDFETTNQGKVLGEDETGGTLEFTFWNFLIGGSARHTVLRHSFVDTIDTTTGDIGWAPRMGLAITFHYEKRVVNIKDPLPGSTESINQEIGAAVFTWQF